MPKFEFSGNLVEFSGNLVEFSGNLVEFRVQKGLFNRHHKF